MWITVTSRSLYSTNTITYDNTKCSLYHCAADGQQYDGTWTYCSVKFNKVLNDQAVAKISEQQQNVCDRNAVMCVCMCMCVCACVTVYSFVSVVGVPYI